MSHKKLHGAALLTSRDSFLNSLKSSRASIKNKGSKWSFPLKENSISSVVIEGLCDRMYVPCFRFHLSVVSTCIFSWIFFNKGVKKEGVGGCIHPHFVLSPYPAVKSPKIWRKKQRIRKNYYKTLGATEIKSLMSSPFLRLWLLLIPGREGTMGCLLH